MDFSMTETIIKVDETSSITKLIASDGMVLTNDEAYSKEIYLGVHDRAENWHEITEAEYEEILAMQNADLDFDIAMLRQKASVYDILTGETE